MPAIVLAAASAVWLLLLAAATSGAGDASVWDGVYRFASYVCHQQPDRSFHWDGAPWPVCARCLGLYAAAPLGALAAQADRPRPLSRGGNVFLLCLAGMFTALTWLGEHLLGWPVSNAHRFAAALPLGAAVAWVIARTLAENSQYTLPDARWG